MCPYRHCKLTHFIRTQFDNLRNEQYWRSGSRPANNTQRCEGVKDFFLARNIRCTPLITTIKSAIQFHVAHRNHELRLQNPKYVSCTGPNRNHIWAQHIIWDQKTRAWAPNARPCGIQNDGKNCNSRHNALSSDEAETWGKTILSKRARKSSEKNQPFPGGQALKRPILRTSNSRRGERSATDPLNNLSL